MPSKNSPAPRRPRKPLVPPKGTRVPAVKIQSAKPGVKTPMPKITTPSRRINIPPDYDVILPGMGYTRPTKKSPPKKIKKR